MSHTSYKVAVSSRNAALTSGQNTHVSTKAGSAGRSAYDCSRFNKGLQKSLFHGLHIDGLGGRNYDAAHAFRHMSALEYLCCGAQIVNTSVGAGTDDYLVDGNGVHLVDLIDGMCILRQMREGHCRLKFRQVDAVRLVTSDNAIAVIVGLAGAGIGLALGMALVVAFVPGDVARTFLSGDAAALSGVSKFSARVKCAMLAWVALEDAIAKA